MISLHLALPREGNLEQVFHIFSYLNIYHNNEMVFNPSDLVINEVDYEKHDWVSSKFGHMQGEVLPGNITEPRGRTIHERRGVTYRRGTAMLEDAHQRPPGRAWTK